MQVPAVNQRDGAAWEARLTIRSGGRTIWIDIDDIDWIEASGDYVTLHAGMRLYMLHESMERIERRLDPQRFARIHRSRIVALSRVHSLSLLPTRDAVITLRDGTELRVSRRFRHRISPEGMRMVSSR
jgi:two-component system LytT family response regulator